jgi:cobalt-zinc-cadmium efflux system outer membrane protein
LLQPARGKRLLLSTLLAIPALASGPGSAAAGDFAHLSLAQAIARALARNPVVVESVLEVRRARGAAAGVAGVLAENPTINLEAGLHRDQGFAGTEAAVGLRVEQPLDLLGQAGSRREAAAAAVTWSEARLVVARAEIAARGQALYVAAQVARRRLALGEERLATAMQTAAALRLRVKLGASSDIDLGMAEAEAGRAQASLEDAQAEDARARLALRDLLDIPADEAALPSDAFAPPPVALETIPRTDELLAHHTAVQAVAKRRLAIDAEIVRLERERLPRLAIALAVERPSAYERFLGVGLSFAPATWRRNQGPLAEARVERERAEVERETTLAGLRRHHAALVEELTVRRRQLAAVEGTLQNEEEVRTLVRAGWQAGKFDFLRLLLAERSVADTKQTRLDLWADLWSNVIEMNRLLGREP